MPGELVGVVVVVGVVVPPLPVPPDEGRVAVTDPTAMEGACEFVQGSVRMRKCRARPAFSRQHRSVSEAPGMPTPLPGSQL